MYALLCDGSSLINVFVAVYVPPTFSMFYVSLVFIYPNFVRIRVMVINVTFNTIVVISWMSVLLVDDPGVPRPHFVYLPIMFVCLMSIFTKLWLEIFICKYEIIWFSKLWNLLNQNKIKMVNFTVTCNKYINYYRSYTNTYMY